MRPFLIVALLATPLATPSAQAHEFWIDALDWHPATGETVRADLRVGSNMQGEPLPWLSARVYESLALQGDSAAPVSARDGDLPALSVPAPQDGLLRITHYAEPSDITYDSTAQFTDYLADEGLAPLYLLHRSRGLPAADFTEAYIRNARALVQVGPVQPVQSDAPTGMPFELVAQGNPYDPDLAAIRVNLTWQGAPVPARQVKLLRTAPDGTVTRDTLLTDAAGSVSVPLTEPGEYLLSAVQLDPFENHATISWLSHWASLTFARP